MQPEKYVAEMKTPELAGPMDFRKTISQFTTGVVVISYTQVDGTVAGATVNSFTSVSLNPASVLFLMKPGRTQEAIDRNRVFGASILAESQTEHSSHFAGRTCDELNPQFCVHNKIPTLQDSLAWFECRLESSFRLHDHMLYVANVICCGINGEDKLDRIRPLTFYKSNYRKLAIVE